MQVGKHLSGKTTKITRIVVSVIAALSLASMAYHPNIHTINYIIAAVILLFLALRTNDTYTRSLSFIIGCFLLLRIILF